MRHEAVIVTSQLILHMKERQRIIEKVDQENAASLRESGFHEVTINRVFGIGYGEIGSGGR